jgi:hypothetical protein
MKRKCSYDWIRDREGNPRQNANGTYTMVEKMGACSAFTSEVLDQVCGLFKEIEPQTGLSFSEALSLTERGKTVTRESWDDDRREVFIDGKLYRYELSKIKYHGHPAYTKLQYTPTQTDILTRDWKVVGDWIQRKKRLEEILEE